VAYNGTLTLATAYLEMGVPTSSTHPDDTQATAMWKQVYNEIFAELGSNGVTIVSGAACEDYVKDVEAMLTSAKVGGANEIQAAGEISPYTKWLKAEGEAALKKLCGYQFAEELGATVTRKGPIPRSMATEYPNENLDTSWYASPLQDDWTREGDM